MKPKRGMELTTVATAGMTEDIDPGVRVKGNGIASSALCAPDAENR